MALILAAVYSPLLAIERLSVRGEKLVSEKEIKEVSKTKKLLNELTSGISLKIYYDANHIENYILKDLSEPSTGFDVLVPIFIIFPTLLFIFSKVYKWKNWKEKLTGKLVKINTED